MLQDLAALAPPLIILVGFGIGVGMLLRHQMSPKRRESSDPVEQSDDEAMRERHERSET